MKYSEIINRVSKELNLPKELIDKTYKAYWNSIRSLITSLPLKEELTEKEFSKLKTNFNIPSLGKLNCTFERYQGIRKRLSLINEINNAKDKETKANVYTPHNNNGQI